MRSPRCHHLHKVHRRIAEHPRGHGVDGLAVYLRRKAELGDAAFPKLGGIATQQLRLFGFGCDIDNDRACFFKDLRNFGAQFLAQFIVKVRQGFVQQDKARVFDQCPGQSAALLLAARQFQRFALQHRTQLHQIGGLVNSCVDLGISLAHLPQGRGEIVVNSHAGKVDELLIDHRHLAILHPHAGEILAVQKYAAGVWHIRPRHQWHQRGLSRRGLPQQCVHRAFLQRQIGFMYMRLAVYNLRDALEYQCHSVSPRPIPLPKSGV
jgi:hypothetical protein